MIQLALFFVFNILEATEICFINEIGRIELNLELLLVF